MGRPQKFRHSREALTDPHIAERLGRFVIEIETLRNQRKQIDDQIAAAYDAVDDGGFEKKFVRKIVSLRAKETDKRRDEEEGLEVYELAIEKGVSLACARSKPVSSRFFAEAKGTGDIGNTGAIDPETGEITEQPETATQSDLTSEVRTEVSSSVHSDAGTLDQVARAPLESASDKISSTHSPSPVAAQSQQAKADDVPPPSVVGTHSEDDDFDPSKLTFLKSEQRRSIADYRPHCQHPENCAGSGLSHCYACRKAMETASATEAA